MPALKDTLKRHTYGNLLGVITRGWNACQDQQGCHAWGLGKLLNSCTTTLALNATHPAITAWAKLVGEGGRRAIWVMCCLHGAVGTGTIGLSFGGCKGSTRDYCCSGHKHHSKLSRERGDNQGLHACKLAGHAQNARKKGWGRSSQTHGLWEKWLKQ